MFSRERFGLSRFSLGSTDTTIHIEATFAEKMNQISGMAVPVQSTAFFNDVVRGTMRGAIAVKTAFDSAAEFGSTCTMNANIVCNIDVDCSVKSIAYGSKDARRTSVFTESLERFVHGCKSFPCSFTYCDNLMSGIYGVKNIKISDLISEAMGCVLDAIRQSTEIAYFNVTLPPGAEIRIDSETYRVLMNGDNILFAQSGDWLTLSRELLYLDIESASGGELAGTIIYTERYL